MASQASAPRGEDVSIGRVLQRAFAVVAANPAVVLGIAFVFGALPGVAIGYFTQLLQTQLAARPDSTRDVIYLTVGSGLVGLILPMLVQGALVRATVAHAEGRAASVGECLGAALRVLLPLIVLTLIVIFAVMFASILLLVPGIMLYVMWSVASPALVQERVGIFGALGRSRALTKGARWHVFALQLVIIVAWWAVTALLGGVAIAAGGGTETLASNLANGLPLTWLIVNAIVSTVVTTFWSTAQTSLYVELRDWKDGPSGETLAGVFA